MRGIGASCRALTNLFWLGCWYKCGGGGEIISSLPLAPSNMTSGVNNPNFDYSMEFVLLDVPHTQLIVAVHQDS